MGFSLDFRLQGFEMPFGLAFVNVSRGFVRIVDVAVSSVGNPLHQFVPEEIELVATLVERYLPLGGHFVDGRRTLAEQLASLRHADRCVLGCSASAAGDGRQQGDDLVALLMEGCQRLRHPVKGKCSHGSS